MLQIKARFAMAFGLFGLITCLICPLPASDSACGPVPYLSWQDIKALYPPHRHIGDWDFLKVNHLPNQGALVERCNQDLRFSLKINPDPFRMNRPLPPGKLRLWAITKDSESRIIYLVFSYQSELVYDLFVIYYYDPVQDRFILKSTR